MNWQRILGIGAILLAIYGAGLGTGAALWYGHTQRQVTETVQQGKDASEAVLPDLHGQLVQLALDKAKLEEKLKNASNNPDCHLSRGDVSLLNHARTGLPDAPADADAEKRTPSDLTQRAEIEAHADCGLRYRALAARHNSLIEWLELSGRR